MKKIPVGYCRCGCGRRTRLAPQSMTCRGWVRGKPIRYICGHSNPKPHPGYRVNLKTGCWEWRGYIHPKTGYSGIMWNGGKPTTAHRVYYENHRGPIPLGMELDHLCKNRPCVNPEHLEIVTRAENTRRSRSAKLSKSDVRTIRSIGRDVPGQELAFLFDISESVISNILAERTWRGI